MKNVALLFFAAAVLGATLGVVGCQSDGNAARTLSATVQQKQERFQAMYRAVDGDWSKLSSADQTSFAADFTNRDLGAAEILWKEMGQSDFPTHTKAKAKRNP